MAAWDIFLEAIYEMSFLCLQGKIPERLLGFWNKYKNASNRKFSVCEISITHTILRKFWHYVCFQNNLPGSKILIKCTMSFHIFVALCSPSPSLKVYNKNKNKNKSKGWTHIFFCKFEILWKILIGKIIPIETNYSFINRFTYWCEAWVSVI